MGAAILTDETGRLLGLLTDGDVRRTFERTADSDQNPLSEMVGLFATQDPLSITADELAAVALNLMESREITTLPVVDADHRLVGIIHMHDLIRSGLA